MTEYEPKSGWYSPWTQRIANELPDWNKIRRRRDSVGQALINPIAGKYMDEWWDAAEKALRNKFPATLNLNEPDLITSITIPDGITLLQPSQIRNKLLNSSFEIWPNQSILPQSWRQTGTGTVVVSETGFVGKRAIEVTPALGSTIGVYQEFDEVIPAGQEWSFSVHYQVQGGAGLTAPATGFGIEVLGYCIDNTTETLRTPFDPTASVYPRRLTLTDSFSKTVSKVRVTLICTRTIGFPFTGTLTIDMVQAEKGSSPTSWMPNPLDNWPHITVLWQLSPILLESGYRMQFVETIGDFWTRAIPTRLEPKVGFTEGTADPIPSGTVISYGTAGRWVEVDSDKEEWPYTAEAYSYLGSHRIRFIGTLVPDILGTFMLAFRNYRSYFETEEIELEAITYYDPWLWIVHKKDDKDGAQKRYLSVVDPRTPWPRPDYLEALVTIEIPDLSLLRLITRVEFRNDDQSHIYIGDGESTFVFSLHYDYFMIAGRMINMREQPDSITVLPAEPTRREQASKDISMDRSRGR